MKITKIAQWKNPELNKYPPKEEWVDAIHSGNDNNPDAQEDIIIGNEAKRLFSQFLKEITPSVKILAQRSFGSSDEDSQYLMRIFILQHIESEITTIIDKWQE